MTCTALQQKERGCEEPVEGSNVLILDGEEMRRCPRRPILEDPELYGELFFLYRQFKQGYLVETGGLNDQPGKLMGYFREMEVAQNKVERFKAEQDARKRRRSSRGTGPRPQGPRPSRR